MTKIFLFAGPSLYEGDTVKYAISTIKLLPPVKRGDICEVIKWNSPSTMVIADGVFHSVLSVGHAEIRNALELGWKVWGVSSMGAIRAAEMDTLGMNGFGEVYERFCSDEDFSDDEVALLHAPMEPYFPISEPMINIRYFIFNLLKEKKINSQASELILNSLKNRWFGERTLELTQVLLSTYGKITNEEAIATLKDFKRFRIKTKDLDNLMQRLLSDESLSTEHEYSSSN